MSSIRRGLCAAILLPSLLLAGAACARATTSSAGAAGRPDAKAPGAAPAPTHDMSSHAGHDMSAGSMAAHDMGLPPVKIPAGAIFTEADVRFMQGMIAHHAQAVAMTRLAGAAGATPRVLKLATKIDLSQAGEIVLMQEWLRANGQFAPDTSSWRTMTMHGMLTADEMAKLAAAKGADFDRLFLTYMIRHHEGAIRMVADLLASPRAAQDVDVSVFANDVETTQSAEIALMRTMLEEM